jgi:MFS family permease
MPLAGALASKVGCRRVIVVSAVVMCAALPAHALVSSLPLLVAVLVLFGGGLGAVDVSMNIQAIIVGGRADGR